MCRGISLCAFKLNHFIFFASKSGIPDPHRNVGHYRNFLYTRGRGCLREAILSLQIDLNEAIQLLIGDRGVAPLDVHEVVALLQEQFPDIPAVELAQRVADQGVRDGARFVSWEPPEP